MSGGKGGGLKSSHHRYLPSGLTILRFKKDLNYGFGFEGSISNVDLGSTLGSTHYTLFQSCKSTCTRFDITIFTESHEPLRCYVQCLRLRSFWLAYCLYHSLNNLILQYFNSVNSFK